MSEHAALGPDAYLVALASLDLSPSRLRGMVDRDGAVAAWRAIVDGSIDVAVDVRRRAMRMDVGQVWQHHLHSGVGICPFGSAGFPPALEDDPDGPAVLFHRGDLDVLSGARVAIVGTRRSSRYGRDVAAELGEGLSAAGVAVISGLALGVDAAAHVGALRAGTPPIAVVGSGLDVVYPRANRALWQQVATKGVVLSEAALGAAPVAWRFPARNRIIAALADVVVVVESHEHGGSLSTVAEAIRRDRPVMAVPGPIHSPASAGANRLLVDGCAPCCGVDDVLVAAGLSPGRARGSAERRPAPGPHGEQVLDALGWQPANLEQLALRSGLSLPTLAVALDELRQAGWIHARGGWYERIGRERALT